MNELMKNLACSGSECFCWILVLLNIFAVFYLVFCSFWKISKLVKLSGWVYSGVLIVATVLVLFFHTCIYTLMATVFTGMMIMAILSIILPPQEPYEKTKNTKDPNAMGAYVISETHDGWFAFELYDAKRKPLISSTYAYRSVEEAKASIVSCRENGNIAETEDRSGIWIQEKYIPKFEVFKCGNMYGFSLRVFEEDSIIHSKMFAKLGPCLKLLDLVKANVGTTDIYMSVEKIHGDNYKKWGFVEEAPIEEEPTVEVFAEEAPIEEAPVVEEVVEEAPIEEEPVVEEVVEEAPIEEEPVVEEVVEEAPIEEEPAVEIVEEAPIEETPVRSKKCIIGVVWPESTNPERIYRYQVSEESVEVGDIVTAPTFDSYKQKDVIRQARVISVEYYEEGANIVLPTKRIISVEKNSI